MTDDECPGSLILYTRKYPNNSTRQDLVFEAALSGNAVSLSNAPINSKHQHPPPRANPGHLNVYFARGVGNLI